MPRQRRFIPLLGLFVVCLSILVGLSGLIAIRFPDMLNRFDVWFRTDVNHYIAWVREPEKTYRGLLHPGTLLLLKPYCLLAGRFLPLAPVWMPLYAAPVLLFHAGALAFLVSRLASVRFYLPVLLVFLLHGPLLLLGPVPESHTMGGLSLLLTVYFTYRALAASEHRAEIRAIRGAGFTGLLATGFSVSNIVPAFLVLLPLLPRLGLRKRWITLVASVAGAIPLLGLMHFLNKYLQERQTGNFLVFIIERFGAWVKLPDGSALVRSVLALVVAPFGIPPTARCHYQEAGTAGYFGVILAPEVSFWQLAALLCWLGGWIVWSGKNHRRPDSQPILTVSRFSLLSLGWLVLFHSVFASDEAYMFSVHAWPFLILPGVLAGRDALHQKQTVVPVLLGVSILLSFVQTVLGAIRLFTLSL